jgi:hypothetical protein
MYDSYTQVVVEYAATFSAQFMYLMKQSTHTVNSMAVRAVDQQAVV